jgi:frataxin-like iron-binding protein CyaY
MDSTAEVKLKSFWEKPEGKTGMLVAAAIVGVGLIGLYKILPWLIALAANTLHLMLLLGAIGVVLFLITNPKVRATASILFQLIMKKLTSCIVKTDPLAILGLKVSEMEENLEKVGESLTKLSQTRSNLDREIAKNASNIETSMKQAAFAQKQNATEQIYLKTRAAGRLQKSNMTLKELFTKVDTMHRILTKIYKNSAVVIADTKDEIYVSAKEYEVYKAASSAMKSAMSIINGNKDKRAIYEEAYEVLSSEISNKSGELQQMLEMSESVMNGIDLQNGMLQEDGLKMLEAWEKKADNWLVTSATKTDAVSKVDTKFAPPVEEAIQQTNNQFSNLFNK